MIRGLLEFLITDISSSVIGVEMTEMNKRYCAFCKEDFEVSFGIDGYGFSAVVHEKCNHMSSLEGDLGEFKVSEDGKEATLIPTENYKLYQERQAFFNCSSDEE